MHSSQLEQMLKTQQRLYRGDYPIEIEARPTHPTPPTAWEGDMVVKVQLRSIGMRTEEFAELEALLFGTTVWVDWWAEAVLYSHECALEGFVAELPSPVYECAVNRLCHRHYGLYLEYEWQEIGFGFHVSAIREVLDFMLLQAAEEGSRLFSEE